MICKSVIALALAAVLAPAAAAQNQGDALCKDGALPFDANPGNRLTGSALQQALTGKRLGNVRELLRTPGVWVNNGRELRGDGSMVYTCQFSRSSSGPWQPCKSFGSTSRQVAGARDIGVWVITNNAVCVTGASFGETSKSCFAIHRQGASLAAKRISGPPAVCLEGPITLQ